MELGSPDLVGRRTRALTQYCQTRTQSTLGQGYPCPPLDTRVTGETLCRNGDGNQIVLGRSSEAQLSPATHPQRGICYLLRLF